MKKKKKISVFKFLFKYFKKYKILLLLNSLIIILFSLSFILTGYLIGEGTEATTNLDLDAALLFFGIYFIYNVFAITPFAGYALSKIQLKISKSISYELYQKILDLPAYAYEELTSGQITNRVSNDPGVIIGTFEQLLEMVSCILTAFVILIYIFFKSYIIALELIIFLIIYSLFVKYFSKRLKFNYENVKKSNDLFSSITFETVRGIREVKTLGIKNNLLNNASSIVKKNYQDNNNVYKIDRNYDVVSKILRGIIECVILITCSYLCIKGKMTISFFIAMTYYIYRFTWLIDNINYYSKAYQNLRVSLERICEILENILYDDVKFGKKELNDCKGYITFKNVNFNYKNEGEIFNNFNIKFEPNKKIAIIGSSGEGKSTIFNLLTRIFDPVSGEIYIDDINIKDLTEESLRKNISIIRQEPFIFNRTIKENFRLVDENITLKEIRKYCKLACIDDYIMSLPKKYNTLLGEGGVNLSGGQKQRLAIARTLLINSKIILFDEATSALDNESQEGIKEAINNLVKDHTILIIAHRLSTIIDADKIYLIKSGKVYASGTHEELIKSCDFYQKLYSIETKTI